MFRFPEHVDPFFALPRICKWICLVLSGLSRCHLLVASCLSSDILRSAKYCRIKSLWVVEPRNEFITTSPLSLTLLQQLRQQTSKIMFKCTMQAPTSTTTVLFTSNSKEETSFSSLSSASQRTEVCNRLGLDDRFGRWRFLQRLLDEEIDSHDATQVLESVLRASIGRKNGGDDGLAETTLEQRQEIQLFLEEINIGERLWADQFSNEPFLSWLEKLLPDPDEDEDAAKGLWDTVMELHGREAVKLGQARGSQEWQASCLIARALIHFDFLSLGI